MLPHPLPDDLAELISRRFRASTTAAQSERARRPRRRLMLELWQTEWCPASRRVRQRLTELGVDYLIRQVPVEKDLRTALRHATGSDVIPAVICDDGSLAIGEDAITRLLDQRLREPSGAEAHRLKAAKARRRYLEEECECLQPATH